MTTLDKPQPNWTDTQQVISYLLVLSFIGVIFIWMIWPPKAIDQAAMTVVNMLIGFLGAKFTTIIDYYFGSSKGSKDKEEANSRMMATLTGTGPEGPNPRSMAIEAAAAAALASPLAAAAVAPPAAEDAAPAAAKAAAFPAAKKALEEALADEMAKKNRLP